MSGVKVETTQNVFFDFEVAQVSDRIFAGSIDLVLVVLYSWGMNELLEGINMNSDDAFGVVVLAVLYMPPAFYHPFMEYYNNGQSVGKMILKNKVIQFDGTMPNLSAILTRWLFRTVDLQLLSLLYLLLFAKSHSQAEMIGYYFMLMIASPVVAIIFISKNGKGQRIGDYLANTTVIKDKTRVSLQDTVYRTLNDTYQPKYKNALQLNDRDIRIIQDTLDNYYKTRQDKYVKELAKKAAKILGVSGSIKAVAFLETIIKDYNYLAVEDEVD